jgi:hypothetical protein
LESVQVRLAYDAARLELIAVRQGTLTGEFEFVIKRQEPGLLYVDMASVTKLAGGTGSVLDLDFRIRADAAPGPTPIDLQWVSLNEGELTLSPAPVPGPDATDGRVLIEPAAYAAPPLATAQPATQPASVLAALTAPQPARVARVEANDTPRPVIDWSANARPMFAGLAKDGGPRLATWRDDFVGNLARGDDAQDPNRKLRVKIRPAEEATIKATEARRRL